MAPFFSRAKPTHGLEQRTGQLLGNPTKSESFPPPPTVRVGTFCTPAGLPGNHRNLREKPAKIRAELGQEFFSDSRPMTWTNPGAGS